MDESYANKKESTKVVGVYTSNSFIESDVIVLATDAALPELCKPLVFDVPVTPSPSIYDSHEIEGKVNSYIYIQFGEIQRWGNHLQAWGACLL